MIRPRPPVRAFGLTALLAVVGAALVVASGSWDWPVAVLGAGIVALVLSVGLLAAAVLAQTRMRVTVELSDKGYRVVEPGGVTDGVWSEVTKVTQAPGRLTFHLGQEKRFHILAPAGNPAELASIADEVSRRLDRDRGYGNVG